MMYNKEDIKKDKEIKIKDILKKYGISGRLSYKQNSLILTFTKGSIDFNEYLVDPQSYNMSDLSISPYWYKNHYFGKALNLLEEIISIMNEGNIDWHINIGKWNNPYKVI